MKHDPRFDSRARLARLEEIADQRSAAAREKGQQIRDLRTEQQRTAQRLAALEERPEFRRGMAEKEVQQLKERLEAIDLDLANLRESYERLGIEHQQTRQPYRRALERAKELGLPIPHRIGGGDFGEPTRFAYTSETTNTEE